jgi:membrane protein implicated in regulation of membrane protease activity
MNDGNADIVFMIAFGLTFVAVVSWSMAIFSRNIDSKVPFVIVPAHVFVCAYLQWLLFDNQPEKIIALPLISLFVIWMFRGIFRKRLREQAEKNASA